MASDSVSDSAETGRTASGKPVGGETRRVRRVDSNAFPWHFILWLVDCDFFCSPGNA